MKYKITKHIPAFCDLNKEKDLFIESLDEIYNLEFVKDISKLAKFDHFSLNEDETLLILHFTNNTYYVLAYIVEIANPTKGIIF
jgi:hypothetical protein